MANYMSDDQSMTLQQQLLGNIQNNDAPQITLAIPIEYLTILSEIIVYLNNLAANGFNFSEMLETQDWNDYFNLLKGPTYPELVKDFWENAYVSDESMVHSNIKGHNICISEVDIARLLLHTNSGIRCYNKKLVVFLKSTMKYS
ncbi:unnamed protein product [Lathyrus sativus]|nr:unnamed protein product [Lathyrus sativus]